MKKKILDVNTKINDIQAAYASLKGPESIMFDITQRCNLHCKHCYNCSRSSYEDDLSDDDMLDITAQIIDVEPQIVCLCGGEPTIRYDLCVIIAEKLAKNNILVNMVTNGYRSDKEDLKRLYNAGVNSIQVSLDSYHPNVMNYFRESNVAHSNAIRAIHNILELGKKPSVTFIPTKINYKEMPLVAKYLYELGIMELRYMPFIPIGRGRINNSILKLSDCENQELFWDIKKASNELSGFKFDYGDPLEHIYLFRNNYEPFNVAYEIKSNGDIQITCYLPFIFGNAKKDRLSELWNGGLKEIWKRKDFNKYIMSINTLEDVENQKRIPYTNNDINLFLDKTYGQS